MAKEEFDKLGFASEEEYERIRSQATVQEGRKEGSNEVPPTRRIVRVQRKSGTLGGSDDVDVKSRYVVARSPSDVVHVLHCCGVRNTYGLIGGSCCLSVFDDMFTDAIA